MGDRNDRMFARPLAAKLGFIQDVHDEVQSDLRAEKIAAERQAILAEAYRQMPSDLRERAKEWNVSALMEAVWLNGWDCGYRQSMRDAKATENPNDR
ncbi:hypothetical protein [Neorhizobium alkalisoli]|uniref:Uncharacterized protein n=1 Tax=Neorhizobium alkalisoli TaxID=528178 RepID=A0A561QS69_9HYPH|nr:hypothetical protein [Neorhizobium alkalisoli]TWF53233.1 hypothetical protein FHW37_104508 [Neorhizobium alkalisoli]